MSVEIELNRDTGGEAVESSENIETGEHPDNGVYNDGDEVETVSSNANDDWIQWFVLSVSSSTPMLEMSLSATCSKKFAYGTETV